jgi:hypothetical protein
MQNVVVYVCVCVCGGGGVWTDLSWIMLHLT